MKPLVKIVVCYIGSLILFGLLAYSLETGRVLLMFTSIILTLPCLRFIILERGEDEEIVARWPAARRPSLIFGASFTLMALIALISAIWNTAIAQAFVALMSLGFGFNFILIWGAANDEQGEEAVKQ